MKTRTVPSFFVSLIGLLPGIASTAVPDDLQLVHVTTVSGSPVAVRHAGDGSNRLFIVTQSGQIYIYDSDSQTLLTTPFLDIDPKVETEGEEGLLGLAFHPNYSSNGQFFVNYTAEPDGNTVIERYQVSSGDANVANVSSGEVVIEIQQPYSNHNGGDIHFGPDGFLYTGMGDGGWANDYDNRAQDPAQLMGKMVRIDVNSTTVPPGAMKCSVSGSYGIPATNPHVAQAQTCAEIWSTGVRNPWRFSFDRLTGDMFIGDVGQGDWEEINFQAASSTGGENWGWRCYEGNHEFNTEGCGDASTYVAPILEVDHNSGDCSITGGYRYRGSIAGLYGRYLYGDYCTGNIWIAEQSGSSWSATLWQDTTHGISSFGEDQAGELYLVDYFSRGIYRFESGTNPAATAQTNQFWIVGAGDISGLTISLDSENFIYTTGGTFGDAFDPAAITELPWGSLNITLTDCDQAEMDYNSDGPGEAGMGAGGYDLFRIGENLAFTECQDQGFTKASANWLSGTWYGGAPRSGEGFFIDVLTDNRAVVAWFSYRPSG